MRLLLHGEDDCPDRADHRGISHRVPAGQAGLDRGYVSIARVHVQDMQASGDRSRQLDGSGRSVGARLRLQRGGLPGSLPAIDLVESVSGNQGGGGYSETFGSSHGESGLGVPGAEQRSGRDGEAVADAGTGDGNRHIRTVHAGRRKEKLGVAVSGAGKDARAKIERKSVSDGVEQSAYAADG